MQGSFRVNLSIPSCDLDKLRKDGIHFCYDQSGTIQHTVIFEFTRTNDKFEGFSGDKRAQKHIRYEPLRRLLEKITTAPCYLAILGMGVCSSFMVKERKAALEPYELNDSLLSEVYMAAAHGAVEVLAEQWKILNIAYANLLKNRSFPVSTIQAATVGGSLPARGHPQGLAATVRKSSGKPTRGAASVPNVVQTDVMMHEAPPLFTARMSRRRKALKQI